MATTNIQTFTIVSNETGMTVNQIASTQGWNIASGAISGVIDAATEAQTAASGSTQGGLIDPSQYATFPLSAGSTMQVDYGNPSLLTTAIGPTGLPTLVASAPLSLGSSNLCLIGGLIAFAGLYYFFCMRKK